MGTDEENLQNDEGPKHEVCVDPFWMAKFETTNQQYHLFSNTHGGKTYTIDLGDKAKQPVVNVSWEEAQGFINWLNKKQTNKFRLPSEAEWEYAARSGTRSDRYWGDNSDETCNFANVHDLSSQRSNDFRYMVHQCDDGYAQLSPVGKFKPNNFGLYDMLGNVWEWTSDWYTPRYYTESQKKNPQGPSSGSVRVVRGSSWSSPPGDVTAINRGTGRPGTGTPYIGIRIVFSEDN